MAERVDKCSSDKSTTARQLALCIFKSLQWFNEFTETQKFLCMSLSGFNRQAEIVAGLV